MSKAKELIERVINESSLFPGSFKLDRYAEKFISEYNLGKDITRLDNSTATLTRDASRELSKTFDYITREADAEKLVSYYTKVVEKMLATQIDFSSNINSKDIKVFGDVYLGTGDMKIRFTLNYRGQKQQFNPIQLVYRQTDFFNDAARAFQKNSAIAWLGHDDSPIQVDTFVEALPEYLMVQKFNKLSRIPFDVSDLQDAVDYFNV